MRLAYPSPTRVAALFAIIAVTSAGTGSAFATEWSVTFEDRFVASTGQEPSNAWKAKVIPNDPAGFAALLEGGGRLTYDSIDQKGLPIIPAVTGKIEFDFNPQAGTNAFNAAFDAGSIIIFSTPNSSALRVTIKLTDAKNIDLVSAGQPLLFGKWNRIILEWDLTKPSDQIFLSIDGKVVARATTTATRLKEPTANFTWGMFGWGGNPWPGLYDNLKIQ